MALSICGFAGDTRGLCSCAPGLRYATPRAVFWRPFRALVVGSIEWGAHRDFRARVEMSNI